MEHTKNSSSDDGRWAAALREMSKGQSLVTQLRAVVLPPLQLASGDRADVVAGMFQSILDSSAKAIAELKLLRLDNRSRDADDAVRDNKKRVRKILSGGNDAKPYCKQRKRRRRLAADDSMTLETPVPDYDGHQWRKYGQKFISNAKHPRSYYKCTYMRDQGCRATKTVQRQRRQQEDGGPDDDPAMYAVVYYGQHTCKPGTAAVVEIGSGAEVPARSDIKCSNISVACTSVVIDHHHHLLDIVGDLADAKANGDDQLFDMAPFSPLDLDTNWATNAYAHGLLQYGEW